MATPNNDDVFVQVQAVINNDWIVRSKRNLTQVLEEIEKIGITEIRFQRGSHVVSGSLDQLVKVQDILMRKQGLHQGKNQTSPRRRDDSPCSLYDAFRSRGNNSPGSEAKRSYFSNDQDAFDLDEPKTVKNGLHEDTPIADVSKTKELMVDRDIWEYIESKKREDVEQLKAVFEATIKKVEDESGVLKVILESKSESAFSSLDVMLETLGSLYEDTMSSCITQTAQFQLSDNESKLALEYISERFPSVLAKKCIYSDNFYFIGPHYESREARKQFEMLARRMNNGDLKFNPDERDRGWRPNVPGNFDFGKHFGKHSTMKARIFDRHDFASECDKDDDLLVVDDDQRQDFIDLVDDNDYVDKRDDISDGMRTPKKNQECVESEFEEKLVVCPADEKERTDEELKSESLASNGKFTSGESEQTGKKTDLTTEDITKSLENLTLEQTFEQNEKTCQAAKSDTEVAFSSEPDETAKNDDVTSTAVKQTKKSTKSKKRSFDHMPKVTIIKQKYPIAGEPSVFNVDPVNAEVEMKARGEAANSQPNITIKGLEKSVPESFHQKLPSREERVLKEMFQQQKKNLTKKPYDSPSSSESEDDRTKKVSAATGQKGRLFTTEETVYKRKAEPPKFDGDENIEALIEELMFKDDADSQAKLQTLLEKVASSEAKEKPEQTTRKAEKGKLPTANNVSAVSELNQSPTIENKRDTFPQPPNGTIACIIDKGFHLNGFNKSGTIEINMSFEAGEQESDEPEPGRPYKSMKVKAFLPASGDGREALRLMKGAFSARKLFLIQRNGDRDEDDIIVSNGIEFKESADQFPDSDYLPNVIDQLRKLTE